MKENEHLSFRLFRTNKAIGNSIMIQVGQHRLPRGSFRLFPYLDVHRDVEVTQKELCEHSHCKPSTISVLIDNLVQDGYLLKTKSKTDNRKTIVKLTEKGTIAAHQIKDNLENIDLKIENALTQQEKEIFLSCLDKITATMEGGKK